MSCLAAAVAQTGHAGASSGGEIKLPAELGNAGEKKFLGPTNSWAPFNSCYSNSAFLDMDQHLFACWEQGTGVAVPKTCVLETDIKLDSSMIVPNKCLVKSIF